MPLGSFVVHALHASSVGCLCVASMCSVKFGDTATPNRDGGAADYTGPAEVNYGLHT